MKHEESYVDRLRKDPAFDDAFKHEYGKLAIAEEIARLRCAAHLTQQALAERISTTKSAVSRYESAAYSGYTVTLLEKIARACGAELRISFVKKRRTRTAK